MPAPASDLAPFTDATEFLAQLQNKPELLAEIMGTAKLCRKIAWGECVEASGLSDIKQAELVGWLLMVRDLRAKDPTMARRMQENGMSHLSRFMAEGA